MSFLAADTPLKKGTPLWQVHIVALVTALVWSTTFVSTKTLLNAGLTPEIIFFYRFLIAYVLVLVISHRRLWADTLRDEALFLLAGISGGSLYFLTENTALRYTYASNVSIIISVTPLLTLALSALVFHQKLKPAMLFGSVLALAGVTLVVLNGETSVSFSLLGDLLTLAAAFCWALYSVVLKVMSNRKYDVVFATRKVFFYGLVTISLCLPFFKGGFHIELLREPAVYGNLLFLGVVASFICFIVWNKVLAIIGPDKANNYIYLSPLGAITTAVIVLHEPVTWMAICGAVVTILGVFIVEKIK